jgi:hypothetical protein
VFAHPVWIVFVPLARVRVALEVAPTTIPFLEPLPPIALILVSIPPFVGAATMHFAVFILAFEGVARGECLKPLPIALVLIPLPFIVSAIFVDADPETFPLVVS